MKRITHPFPSFHDEKSTILILGSFPSVKSREQMFFYGHPQNRFWKVLAGVFDENFYAEENRLFAQSDIYVPQTIPEKKVFLAEHHLALWDVIAACDISGSADASIRNVVPNDLSEIIDNSPIEKIIVNGRTAEKYYKKYTEKIIGYRAICLPSTSPANAAWSVDKLIEEWGKCLRGE